jgi:hypothetical protein
MDELIKENAMILKHFISHPERSTEERIELGLGPEKQIQSSEEIMLEADQSVQTHKDQCLPNAESKQTLASSQFKHQSTLQTRPYSDFGSDRDTASETQEVEFNPEYTTSRREVEVNVKMDFTQQHNVEMNKTGKTHHGSRPISNVIGKLMDSSVLSTSKKYESVRDFSACE